MKDAREHLKAVGFKDFELIRERYDPENFGNGEVIFRIGRLAVRFQRDRSQDFVDLGSTATPERFHQFDDVDIAMGWRSVEQVLAKREPEALMSVLSRLFQNYPSLEDAFSDEQERFTRARVEKAAKERGEAFVAKLRRGYSGDPDRG